ncbi:MAG: TraB/GumN family protein [Imperialibacter sp.]|uniref:TraB/GumN family protein n=1 Tax=Imperialibacter sp. TaxID=2038411 RepID=UPI0032EEC804
MKKLASILLAIFLGFIAGRLAASERQSDVLHTLLFRIVSPNGATESYLFGTHHAFSKSFFDTLSNTRAKLMAAEIVITESDPEPGHTANDIVNARTSETQWSKYLTKADLAYLREHLHDSPTNFEKLRPEELYAALNREYTINACNTRTAADPNLSIDEYIGFLAKQAGKRVIGLETADEQLELIRKDIEGMPPKVHKKRLSRLIQLIKSGGNSQICEATDMYRQMAFDYRLTEPCFNSLILTDRNTRWLEKIVGDLQSSSCFVAVGLSHLQFECGLISQLREGGFVVEPISTTE